ncbi:hypothetical protein T08_14321 [Trichinella sp. T8]|nr:hypothetical protein T08_14321 [Trichinella sp. T8]
MNCKANKIILPDIKHKCLNILFLDFGLANSYNLKKIPFSLITSIPNVNAGKRRNFNMKRSNNNRLFNASNFLIRIIHSYSTSTSNQHMPFSDVLRQKDKNPNIFIAYSIFDRLQFWNDFEEQWTINNIAINFG